MTTEGSSGRSVQVVSAYLVAQDGLLHQPRVPVQADPGIAPAPHPPDAQEPRLTTCSAARAVAAKQAWSQHTQLQSVLGMGLGGRRSGVFKTIQRKYDWKTSQPEFLPAGRCGGGDGGWHYSGSALTRPAALPTAGRVSQRPPRRSRN